MKSYCFTILLSAGGMWFTAAHDEMPSFLVFLAVFTLATAGLWRLHTKGEAE